MSSRVIAQLLALSLAAGMVQSKRVNGVNAGSGGSLEASVNDTLSASVNDTQLAGAGIKICKALNDMQVRPVQVSLRNYELKVECQQDGKKWNASKMNFLGEAQYAYTVMVSDTVKNSQVIFKPASQRPLISYRDLGSVNGHVQVATEVSLLLGEPADLTGNPLTDLMGEAPEGRELCLFASLEHQIGTKTIHPWIGPTIAGYEVGVLNLAFCNPVTESGRAVPSKKQVQKTGPDGRPRYSMEIDAEHAVEFK